ncbi:hypothetical protein SAXI111661_02575 [Saccharomonospora xinjiangensis]|nr:hypothetical protein EYD13_18145 [Saccharomonospora xinjiangensis]
MKEASGQRSCVRTLCARVRTLCACVGTLCTCVGTLCACVGTSRLNDLPRRVERREPTPREVRTRVREVRTRVREVRTRVREVRTRRVRKCGVACNLSAGRAHVNGCNTRTKGVPCVLERWFCPPVSASLRCSLSARLRLSRWTRRGNRLRGRWRRRLRHRWRFLRRRLRRLRHRWRFLRRRLRRLRHRWEFLRRRLRRLRHRWEFPPRRSRLPYLLRVLRRHSWHLRRRARFPGPDRTECPTSPGTAGVAVPGPRGNSIL